MTFPELRDEALRLAQDQRAELAYMLVESLDELEDADHGRAWIEEARRRASEIREGKIRAVPAAQVLEEVASRLT